MQEITHAPYPYTGDEDAGYPDTEMETLHVYLVPDHPRYWNKDRIATALMAVAWCAVMIAWIAGFFLLPASPIYTVETITVPAHFSVWTMQAHVAIIPTGKHTSPATAATGVITIYNGSFLAQQLSAGFIVTTLSGIEVITDAAVTIPAGNPPNYGMAIVAAHVLMDGASGNIPALSINQAYAPLYLKNLSPFTGGKDATTTTYATNQDQARAQQAAEQQLAGEQPIGLLARPCSEQATKKALMLSVAWVCQYVHYALPAGQILSVHVAGNSVILRIRKEQTGRGRY